jgi:hypothetical protein
MGQIGSDCIGGGVRLLLFTSFQLRLFSFENGRRHRPAIGHTPA